MALLHLQAFHPNAHIDTLKWNKRCRHTNPTYKSANTHIQIFYLCSYIHTYRMCLYATQEATAKRLLAQLSTATIDRWKHHNFVHKTTTCNFYTWTLVREPFPCGSSELPVAWNLVNRHGSLANLKCETILLTLAITTGVWMVDHYICARNKNMFEVKWCKNPVFMTHRNSAHMQFE